MPSANNTFSSTMPPAAQIHGEQAVAAAICTVDEVCPRIECNLMNPLILIAGLEAGENFDVSQPVDILAAHDLRRQDKGMDACGRTEKNRIAVARDAETSHRQQTL